MKNSGRFSARRRTELLTSMASQKLDLLIVGGGITGAGIALDAAARGLSVGLVEKQDFGAGTSSRSTKLIHGGLRYLKQGEVKLVQEVGKERAILYRNAPHLVLPEKMLLPLVEKGTYGKLATSFGLWLYDLLAGVVKEERRVMLSKSATERQEPLLRKDILKGGGLYIEYRTDDARLTTEVMKTAHARGAQCVNYAEVTEFLYSTVEGEGVGDTAGKIIGAAVTDRISGETYRIHAKKIVNAAGPWVDRLREKDNSLYGKRLHLTKGVHLVVPHERLPLQQSIYFDVPDGRMMFAIPRDATTYIGTTDTNYQGSLQTPRVTQADVTYLLEAVNQMFPTVKLTEQDIVSSWAGLRPLIHEDGKSPSELSRKDEIFRSKTGLITIAGGKLTGFRKMAERIVDLVTQELSREEGRTFSGCQTDTLVLSGGSFDSPKDIPAYIDELTKRGGRFGATRELIAALVGKYGSNTTVILQQAEQLVRQQSAAEPLDAKTLLLSAELWYGVENEMAADLGDFLVRRSGRLLFERDQLPALRTLAEQQMAALLQWSETETEARRTQFEAAYLQAVEYL